MWRLIPHEMKRGGDDMSSSPGRALQCHRPQVTDRLWQWLSLFSPPVLPGRASAVLRVPLQQWHSCPHASLHSTLLKITALGVVVGAWLLDAFGWCRLVAGGDR